MSKHYSLPVALLDTAQAHHLAQLNDQEFWNYAAELAYTHTPSTNSSLTHMICSFDEGRYILPLASLTEVLAPPSHYTLLPFSPSWVTGITVWRNETIPVIDFASYLQQHTAQTRPDFIAFASFSDITVGFLIKVVDFTSALPTEKIQTLRNESVLPATLCPLTVQGIYEDAFIFDLPELLTSVVHALQDTSYAQ